MKPNPISDLARRDPHCRDELAAAIERCMTKRGRYAGQLADRAPVGDYTRGVWASLLSTACPARTPTASLMLGSEMLKRGFHECEAWQARGLLVPKTDRKTIRVQTAAAYLLGAPLRFSIDTADPTIREAILRLVTTATGTAP